MIRPVACLVPALLIATPASAQLSPAQLLGVGVTPPPSARLPGGRYIDQSGRAMTLRPGRVPTLLLFADYTCAHLCGPGVTLTAGALQDAGLVIDRDYRLVVIGLDQDGPAKARAFAAADLRAMPQIRDRAALLTGDVTTVAAAEQSLGYHAVHDPATDQFAHDAASFLFTPDGRLSRILPEVGATPRMLSGAVAGAGRGVVATTTASAPASFIGLCYGFAAAHGLYGGAVVLALRLLAVLTLGGIALVIWRLSRRKIA